MKTEMENLNKIMEQVRRDRRFRVGLTEKSHFWFFHVYFSEYISCETAPFQKELLSLTEQDYSMLVVLAFRGSAKSTICTMSLALWSILGVQQKKFVLIVCQTQAQARFHLQNLRREMEGNALLRDDLGPFTEHEEEWNSGSLVIPKYGARITAVSLEQSVRGLRHGAHRPDLIICDDIEDLSSVKTRESRQKTYQWFTRDLIPVGDMGTNIVVVGNLLHEDSLISRLKEEIENNERGGKVVEYPLIDKEGRPLWPGKYKTKEDIQELKRKVVDEVAWSMEYLLEIVSDIERVVQIAWIQRYPDDYFASSRLHRPTMVLGVDLAISEKETADYTAIVPVIVSGTRDNVQVFVTTPIVNKRMSFAEQLDTIERLYHQLIDKYYVVVVVEDVGYQRALIQSLEARGCKVESFKVGIIDKRTRLNLISPRIRDGEILFPKTGVDHLVAQIVGFGVEKHDDLMDAFVMAATYGFERSLKRSRIIPKKDSRSPAGWRRVSSNTFEAYY
jgi:predicted phage terminase large subunit-like protein